MNRAIAPGPVLRGGPGAVAFVVLEQLSVVVLSAAAACLSSAEGFLKGEGRAMLPHRCAVHPARAKAVLAEGGGRREAP